MRMQRFSKKISESECFRRLRECEARSNLVSTYKINNKGLLENKGPFFEKCANAHNVTPFLLWYNKFAMFWRVKRSKILLQASLHRVSDLLTLVSYRVCLILCICSSWIYLCLLCFTILEELSSNLREQCIGQYILVLLDILSCLLAEVV